MRSLNISASGMLAQQLNIAVISDNLSKLQVSAFKRQRLEFAEMAPQNLRTAGASTSGSGNVLPTGAQIGLGVKPVAISRIMLQGEMKPTGNPLDLGIEGKGYFRVELPNGGTAYTRAGSFQLSPNGALVTNEGYFLQPQITVPPEAVEISISNTGEVMAKLANNPTPQSLGQLELTNFANPAGLQALGDNLSQETAASGSPTAGAPGNPGFGMVKQGVLESSNVDPVVEMTTMVECQRHYEMCAESVKASSEMMATANRLRS
ncbi:MAG: flagellar basal-body rod protein FlgG [Alphaproteobacteria bacterium]|nr:flagellar basal-body rod protein FlgG [Alphaproteobacteria bacterium]OJV45777.1 MAG: flagellar basal-body rod protein FlgG [Alphaproteobacteria bacterium 43-37]